MKVLALISGGKDSTYNMMQCVVAGHEIVGLANLFPISKNELDSYMYQSVGFEGIDLIASAMDLPIFKKETKGKSSQKGKIYVETKDDEVEDLFDLLSEAKQKLDFEAVSVGAILSDYQRVRVEDVCNRLGLVSLAYLWQRNQKELLDEMINCEVDAVLIKVASLGLEPKKHLGRTLSSMQSYLHSVHEKYGVNICGEGGEYETFTLDCPLFKSRIVIMESEIVIHSDDPIAPVGYLKLNKLHLEKKLPILKLHERLKGLPLRDSEGYVTDQGEDCQDLKDELDSESMREPNLKLEADSFEKSLAKQNFSVQRAASGWLWIGGIRGDKSEPMAASMNALNLCLSSYNHTLSDVCAISMYINNMKSFEEMNKSYISYFNFPNPPTRACVEVPLHDECPLLLEAISWKVPEDVCCDPPVERHTMHVQSWSHWAPANIGPYSQAVKIGELIYLAGQIGLIPGNLQLVEGGVTHQCRLALRNVEQLLKALDTNLNLRNVVQGICYVKNISSIQRVRKLWEECTNNAIVDYVVVSDLPKSALVEWHVWAHRFNHLFEYEETGRCIDDKNWSISIFRRWNHENNIAAVVCHLEKTDINEESVFNTDIFIECLNYAMQKLKQGHQSNCVAVLNLKIFYPVSKNVDVSEYFTYFDEQQMKEISLTYTFVPVLHCKNENTHLSICGTRTD